MSLKKEKDQKAIFSLGLLALTVLLIGFTAAQVISMTRGTSQGPLLTRETLDQITNGNNSRQYLDAYQTAAEKLSRKNMFVPPPAGPAEPGDCTAIFGDEARIGDRWYKAGDKFGDAEVIAVGPTQVTLLFEDKRIIRTPVLKIEDNSRRSSSSRFSSREQSRNRSRDQSRDSRSSRSSSSSRRR